MPSFTIILLLAAYSTFVIAGPVPYNNRRQLFTSYANTTAKVTSSTQVPQASLSSAATTLALISTSGALTNAQPTSIPQSSSQRVNADTALVIEPIQKTVITQINPAITFLNPKGEPIASQGAETILITSYFTPTPAPAVSSSVIAISSPSSTPSPSSSQLVPSPQSSTLISTAIPPPALPQSSQAVVESGPVNITSIPSFTYSPQASDGGLSITSPAPAATSKVAAGNSTGLPGFSHPSLVSQSAKPTSVLLSSAVVESSSVARSPLQTSLLAPSSSGQPIPAVSSSNDSPANSARSTSVPIATDSKSRVVITKTLYTTVYPSSAAVQKPSPTPSKGAELGGVPGPSQSQQSIVSPSNAPVAPSPSPLAPPPVVIVTQYTTITPSPAAEPSQVPEVPSTPVVSKPSLSPVISSIAKSSSPAAASPTPVPSSAAQPTVSSKAPDSPAKPTSSVAPSLPPQASSSTTAVAQPPPSPPAAPPAASSTTSDGPLIITPIAPSQIFTVTITTTEKETVTETATVSVTVRA